MANLVLIILLGWLGGIHSVNEKSHVIGHIMTLQIFNTPKSCAFREITKKCLIDSNPWVGLS